MRRFAIALICTLWVGFSALAQTSATRSANAQDCIEGSYGCGHEENHEQYKEWHRESGMSCCSMGDCRPTRAYQDDDGAWHAWDGEKWRKVPPEALLQQDILKDGRSHLCAPPGGLAVYCFSPAQPKS